MRNNSTFLLGVIKSSPRVWIWKYRYSKWDGRLHLDGFWVFIFYAQHFKPLEIEKAYLQSKIQRKHMENLTKVQKSAESILAPCPCIVLEMFPLKMTQVTWPQVNCNFAHLRLLKKQNKTKTKKKICLKGAARICFCFVLICFVLFCFVLFCFIFFRRAFHSAKFKLPVFLQNRPIN